MRLRSDLWPMILCIAILILLINQLAFSPNVQVAAKKRRSKKQHHHPPYWESVWPEREQTTRQPQEEPALDSPDGIKKEWEKFKERYNKTFVSQQDEKEHLAIFERTLKVIARTNKQPNRQYLIGITQFADMKPNERSEQFAGLRLSEEFKEIFRTLLDYLKQDDRFPQATKCAPIYGRKDAKLDCSNEIYSPHHRRQPTKVRRPCSNGWIASTLELLEHELVDANMTLSQSNLLSCLGAEYKSMNCKQVGCAYEALKMIGSLGGLMLENEFPTSGGQCSNFDKDLSIIQDLQRSLCVSTGRIGRMRRILGPAITAMHVPEDLWHYKKGFYSNNQCEGGLADLNHEVLIVGRELHDGEEYLEVKNSWGPDWGINGHFMIRKGDCGIGTYYIATEC